MGSISPTCLHEVFPCTDSKSAKRQSSHQYLCTILGSACEKVARKTLVKLTHSLNHELNIISSQEYSFPVTKARILVKKSLLYCCHVFRSISIYTTGCQFHKHFMSSFFIPKCFSKLSSTKSLAS